MNYNRRDILKLAGVGALGLVIPGIALGNTDPDYLEEAFEIFLKEFDRETEFIDEPADEGESYMHCSSLIRPDDKGKPIIDILVTPMMIAIAEAMQKDKGKLIFRYIPEFRNINNGKICMGVRTGPYNDGKYEGIELTYVLSYRINGKKFLQKDVK